ncbi:MAG: hypothetical protein AAGA21_24690 [Pseudomonadota bacterium]
MAIATDIATDQETLEEIAARLIFLLGLDKAIRACRGNAWHSVLPFVMAYKKATENRVQSFGFFRPSRAQRAPAMSLPIAMAA